MSSETLATLAALIPLLRLIASASGSAYTASRLFELIRSRWPDPLERPAHPLALAVYTCIYAPKFARISAIVLAVVISLAAQASLAAIQGRPILATIDQALAAILAPLIGQLIHGQRELSTETPADKAAKIHAEARRPTSEQQRAIAEAERSPRARLAVIAEVNKAARQRFEATNRAIRELTTLDSESRPIFRPGIFEADREGYANQTLADWSAEREGLHRINNARLADTEQRIAHLTGQEHDQASLSSEIAHDARSYEIDTRYNEAILSLVRDQGAAPAQAVLAAHVQRQLQRERGQKARQ